MSFERIYSVEEMQNALFRQASGDDLNPKEQEAIRQFESGIVTAETMMAYRREMGLREASVGMDVEGHSHAMSDENTTIKNLADALGRAVAMDEEEPHTPEPQGVEPMQDATPTRPAMEITTPARPTTKPDPQFTNASMASVRGGTPPNPQPFGLPIIQSGFGSVQPPQKPVSPQSLPDVVGHEPVTPPHPRSASAGAATKPISPSRFKDLKVEIPVAAVTSGNPKKETPPAPSDHQKKEEKQKAVPQTGTRAMGPFEVGGGGTFVGRRAKPASLAAQAASDIVTAGAQVSAAQAAKARAEGPQSPNGSSPGSLEEPIRRERADARVWDDDDENRPGAPAPSPSGGAEKRGREEDGDPYAKRVRAEEERARATKRGHGE